MKSIHPVMVHKWSGERDPKSDRYCVCVAMDPLEPPMKDVFGARVREGAPFIIGDVRDDVDLKNTEDWKDAVTPVYYRFSQNISGRFLANIFYFRMKKNERTYAKEIKQAPCYPKKIDEHISQIRDAQIKLSYALLQTLVNVYMANKDDFVVKERDFHNSENGDYKVLSVKTSTNQDVYQMSTIGSGKLYVSNGMNLVPFFPDSLYTLHYVCFQDTRNHDFFPALYDFTKSGGTDTSCPGINALMTIPVDNKIVSGYTAPKIPGANRDSYYWADNKMSVFPYLNTFLPKTK